MTSQDPHHLRMLAQQSREFHAPPDKALCRGAGHTAIKRGVVQSDNGRTVGLATKLIRQPGEPFWAKFTGGLTLDDRVATHDTNWKGFHRVVQKGAGRR